MQTRARQRANEQVTTRCAVLNRKTEQDPTIKMSNNLIELANQCPGLQVTITLGELIEANTLLIAEAKEQLEALITDAHTETYPTTKKVQELLGVSETTLWRWAKIGYLVPLSIGGKKRYRQSDIDRILQGDNTQKGATA